MNLFVMIYDSCQYGIKDQEGEGEADVRLLPLVPKGRNRLIVDKERICFQQTSYADTMRCPTTSTNGDRIKLPKKSRPDVELGFTEFGTAGLKLGRHHAAAFSAHVQRLATRQPREEEEEEGDEMLSEILQK